MGTDATLDERFSDQQNPPSQPARHVLRGPSPPRRPSQVHANQTGVNTEYDYIEAKTN